MRAWLAQRSRAWRVLAGLGIAAAFVLAFVPLFNMIGYESAAFYGVLYGFSTSYLAFEDDSWRAWVGGLGERLALAAAPFAILTANALFVRNCDYIVGVQFWGLIVGGAILVATTLGWAVRALIDSTRAGNTLITVIAAATVVDFAVRLALEPPITGHHWFLGYFSGSIYDEALAVPHSLVVLRLIHLGAVMAVVLGLTAIRDRTGHMGAVALLCAAVSTLVYVDRRDHGIDLNDEYIVDALGGRVESDHFIIYFAANSPHADDIERIIEDHEFRYAEMKAYFGTDPVALHGEKVKSFVYPDRERKGALMGARRTLVAKIWLREMHILWRYYGDHMLAHELAHVFTEPFGTGPLRLSTRYVVLVNMGLVEGIATAADWDSDDIDPHRASAALRRMDKAPDIVGLLGASGFWTQSSGRAYTLMGSFIRWLVDQHGMEKLQIAYGHGDFEGVYGQPASELVAGWATFLDGLDLTEEDLELARYFYDRKSIFQKVCARTIGELREQVSAAASARDRARARALMDRILEFDPNNVDYRIESARLSLALGEEQGLRALEQLAGESLDAAERAHVLGMLGDALWRKGDVDGAIARYTECLGDALPVEARRLLLAKRGSLDRDATVRDAARLYFLEPGIQDDVRVLFPAEWADKHPDDPLAAYLVGRRFWAGRLYGWAEPHLRRALTIDAGPLRDEAHLMLVQSLHFQRRPTEVQAAMDAWSPAERTYTALKEEWAARIAWAARNTIDGVRR